MDTEFWRNLLAGALAFNAAVGLGYRFYRHRKGGPIADVWGQAVLAVLLLAVGAALVSGLSWPRWLALAYAVLYTFVAMPVFVLGVLLPLPPRAIDWAFTVVYWVVLVAIGVAAIAM